MRVRPICSLLLALVACATEEAALVPFRGDYRPDRIAVLPIAADGLPLALVQELDAEAHAVVGSRGYEVVPVEVSNQMLASLGAAEVGPLDEAVLRRMRSEYYIDTVLARRARPEKPYGDPLAAFVVQWELIDTHSGSTVWVSEQGGGTDRTTQLVLKGQSAYSDDPLLSDEPMVQRSTGSWVTEVPPPTLGELAYAVQAAIASRMPPHVPFE